MQVLPIGVRRAWSTRDCADLSVKRTSDVGYVGGGSGSWALVRLRSMSSIVAPGRRGSLGVVGVVLAFMPARGAAPLACAPLGKLMPGGLRGWDCCGLG